MPSYQRKIPIPGKSAKEIYGFIDQHLDSLLAKFSVGNMGVKRNAAAHQFAIESSMFNATLSCLEGSVELNGKLSMLATPFKGKIDEGIDRFLAKYMKG